MKNLEKRVMRLLLADCDDLVREGIHSVLSRTCAGVSIDEVRTFIELTEALSSQEYDLVIVEPLVTGKVGVEAIKHMRESAPESDILVFTHLSEITHGALSMSYGAKGFLMKNCSVEDFLKAVQWIQKGRIYVGAALANQLATSRPCRADHFPHDSLTEKETLVYSMLVCGMRVVEIAKKLNLSQKTISTHKSRILSKFRFQRFSDLLNYTAVYGLIGECRSRVKRFYNTLEMSEENSAIERQGHRHAIQLSGLASLASTRPAGCAAVKSHCAAKSARE